MASTNTSSGVRHTPGYAVPSTQNTAPVLDYRCLYTHDLRRKQKRWQDGLLRFHTFNKRIMVYDVSRNYIGDMHWREDEILQDGDEFKLDRGILIQVGEATGSVEQDLTGLFEKRKKAPEVAVIEEISHQSAAALEARPTTVQPSQLRPKTLNALLGTPKGRIGRAALPTKSPHELCTENENDSWNHDRPAKRQRLESRSQRGTEPNKMPAPQVPANFKILDARVDRTVVGAIVDKQSEKRRVPTTVRNVGLSSVGNAVSKSAISKPPRGNILNEDEAFERVIDQIPKERSSGPRSSEPTEKQRKRKSGQDGQVSPKAKKPPKRRNYEPETRHARSSITIKPIEIASDEDVTSTNEQPKQGLKLQIASRKPRKKLMYRDLLPQEKFATGRSSGSAPVLDRSTSSRPDKRKKNPMAEFHKEEQDQLKARLNRRHAKEMHRESEREEFCGEAPEDLFLSQEDVTSAVMNHHRTMEKETIENASLSSLAGSRRHNTEPVPSSSGRSLSPEVPPKVIPRPLSTVHSTAMTLAKMDEILIWRPQPRTPESVGDNDVLPEVLPQESPPPPIPKTPPDVVSTPSPPKDRPNSSPAFQTQARPSPSKTSPPEARIGTSIISRPNTDSLSTFTKVVRPKGQVPKGRNSNIPPPSPQISSIPPTSPTSPSTISAPSPTKDRPVLGPSLQAQPDVRPIEPPHLEPSMAAIVPPIRNMEPNTLPAFTKVVVPKPQTAVQPAPRSKPDKQPAFTKVVPIALIPKPPDAIVEVLSSQPSTPPPEAPITPPRPPKRKPDSLPAFTKVIPTKARSPLRKARSDTSAMRPPSALPVSGGKENPLWGNQGGREETASLWSKEAWDLFGCSRDGVECTYEEFKRKEGLA
ncbi:MAG: hypothetical protein ALECFALPRED_006744 [Alectoria fallacina]|uniref:5'-3' DNA helicase ZGRF1-like N-terminal domain-containing protein n=1 Tax=Alectoria fallacina TaxID=1903189 RepID=A0A8H3G3X2_9LECA|nr:MAG: hypothetical protein ALECFALPRED_006744 [Alectoria fallacina]